MSKVLQMIFEWLPSMVKLLSKNEKLIKASERVAGLKPIKMSDEVFKPNKR